jgi:hypothetical protein
MTVKDKKEGFERSSKPSDDADEEPMTQIKIPFAPPTSSCTGLTKGGWDRRIYV